MRSKADGQPHQPPICYDDSVVILRLTRYCEEAYRALSESPALDDARKRVEDAGCSLFPASMHGACSLLPLVDEQVLELGLKLEKHHILALRSDKSAIAEALRMVPRGDRPKIRDDHRADPIEDEHPLGDVRETTTADNNDIFEEIDLLHPLVRAKIRQFAAVHDGTSEPSVISWTTVTESAPCGDAPCLQKGGLSNTNPRHWKK